MYLRRTRFLLAAVPLIYINAAQADKPEINILGAPENLESNILAHLSIASEICDLSDWRAKRRLKDTDSEVQRAAQALGYYRLKFTKEYAQTESCWSLTLRVDPGPQVIVTKLDIVVNGHADNDEDFNTLLNNLPLQIGAPLNHSDYDRIKSSLSSLALEKGYFDAQFTQAKLQIYPSSLEAEIIIHFDSGARFLFGEIEIEQSFLSDDFINRYKTIKRGDYYSNQKLLELREVLNNSRYFERVNIREQLDDITNREIPVLIELTQRPRRSYAVGLGAATDTGVRLKLEYEDRYLNGQGHSLDSDLILSPVRSEFNVDYRIPLQQPATEHLGLYGGIVRENIDNADFETLTLGSRYSTIPSKGWGLSYFLNYQRETFEVMDDTELTRLLIPGISVTRIKTDDPTYPLHGWRFSTQLRSGSDKLVSDINFTHLSINLKAVEKFGPGRILARIEAGTVNTNNFSELPNSLRFYAGGDNSVRGYEYKTLSPVDDLGETIGGENLLVGSIEYDYRFKGSNWAAAIFYDQGNAYTGDERDLKRSAGMGIRWISPIGPIRLDAAQQLDDEKDYRFHLSMGPDF